MNPLYPSIASFLHQTRLPIPYVVRGFLLDHFPGHSRKFVTTLKHTSLSLELNLRDGLQNTMYPFGVYEPDISNWCAFFASRSHVILDIGAHCGYFSLLAAHFSGPAGLVFAFEPHPLVYPLLKKNIQRNQLEHRVHATEAACGDANHERVMFFPGCFNLGTGSFARIKHFKFKKKIKVVTLDSYLQARGIGVVDFMKMDIEGGEYSAVQGMRRGLGNGDYKIVFLDLHPHLIQKLGGSIPEMIHAFRSFHYTIYRVTAKGLVLIDGDLGTAGGYHCLVRGDLFSEVFGRQKLFPLTEPFSSMFL